MRRTLPSRLLRATGGLLGLLVLLAASSTSAEAQRLRAKDDNRTTAEDTELYLPEADLLENDSGRPPLSIVSVTEPRHGTATLGTDGAVTYTPGLDFFGEDEFKYTMTDASGDTKDARVKVTVTPVNDAPVARDDAAATAEDTPVTIDVLANDDDPDGDDPSITAISRPGNGQATIEGARVRYTPDEDFTGTDTFTYTISDGNGGTASGTVEVTVDPVNDAPTARDDEAAVDEDGVVTVEVLANDSDDGGENLTVTSVTAPRSGSATTNGTTVRYTPNADFNGTDSFVYTVADEEGATATARVTVTVRPVNDRPIARALSFDTTEDTPLVVPAPGVLANDDDPDGDALTAVLASGPGSGTLDLNTDGSFTYTPEADFTGDDSFQYRARDGSLSSSAVTVTVSVGGVNDAPTARDDAATTDEGQNVTIEVLANDTDPDGDALRVASVGQPTNGTASVVNGGQRVRYTPDEDFAGSDAFTYTASDGRGGTSVATVRVTVTPVNDAPVARDDAATTPEGTPVTIDVLANDDDPDGDELTITGVSEPEHGTVTAPDGDRVRYVPDANFNGSDAFTYTVSDGNGGSTTADVSITVTAVNDGPIARNDVATVAEDGRVGIGVLANDTDPDGTSLTISSVTNPANGTASTDGATVVYAPDPDFNGTDAFVYTVLDAGGASATATVTVTVTPVNDAPTAGDDEATVPEDTSTEVLVLDNDDDPDGDDLVVTSVDDGASGTTTISAGGASVIYTPNEGFVGEDAFDYTISDGAGGTATATVAITVSDVNIAPTARDDAATTSEDTAVVIAVLANDTDPDGDALTVTDVTDAASGTVEVAGNGRTVTYTPDEGFTGTDAFDYTASDGAATSTATVTVTVQEVGSTVEVSLDDAAQVGDAASVSVDVQGFAPTSATLYYRPSGADAFDAVPLTRSGGTYAATVPSEAVTIRGLDLYAVLSDGTTTFAYPTGAPEAEPLHVRVAVDRAQAPVAFPDDGLRMVSVPLVLNDPAPRSVFADDFGSYDPAVWRLFRWQPGDERYAEYPSVASDLAPGVGVWLAARAEAAFDVEDGQSVTASGPVALTLQPGWNQIGSPFAFPVAWSSVGGSASVSPPAGWDGREYDLDVAVLQPWEGYFVENRTDAPVTLSVPPVEATAEEARLVADGGGYRLRLRAEAGDLRDTQNLVGFAEAERARSEPPPPGDHVRLSVVDGDRRLAHSFRSPQGGGAAWDVEVTASPDLLRGDALTVSVALADERPLPEGYGRHVLDLDRGLVLPAGPFAVRLSTAEPVRRLRVIVGTEAFAVSASEGISTEVPGFVLEPARPNPFHTATTIAYALPEAGPVALDVYDALGRHVATLAEGEQDAGRHVATWDAAGTQSGGVYVVRLRTATATASAKVTLIR